MTHTEDEALKLALDDLMVEYDMERTSFAKRVDEIFKQTPPAAQRPWVGLTGAEIDELSRTMVKGNKSVNWLSFSIEARLKENNDV
jgi:phage terminase Nu1 subunit (DNA packaging protein)